MYVLAHVTLHWGRSPEFNELMPTVVRIMGEQGWSLISAYQNATGDYGQVLDIWEAPDGASLPDDFAKMGQHRDFAPVYEKLKEILVREEISICVKTPFSP